MAALGAKRNAGVSGIPDGLAPRFSIMFSLDNAPDVLVQRERLQRRGWGSEGMAAALRRARS